VATKTKTKRDTAVMDALARKVSGIVTGTDRPRRTRPQRIDSQLRVAVRLDGRSHNALAVAAGITPQQIGRFMLKDGDPRHRDLTLTSAAKLAATLGLELFPVR
jgi:hypothetical protein